MIRNQAFMPRQMYEDFTPNQTGKLKGYCAGCGAMLMTSDDQCPKCEGTEVVASAPQGVELPVTTGWGMYQSKPR